MSFICDLFGAYIPLSLDFLANKLRASKAEVGIRIPAVAQTVLLADLPAWYTDFAFECLCDRNNNTNSQLDATITDFINNYNHLNVGALYHKL